MQKRFIKKKKYEESLRQFSGKSENFFAVVVKGFMMLELG